MKKSILLTAVFGAILFALAAKTTYADCSGQYGQYGGCNPSTSINIDKTIAIDNDNNGSADSYVDNLSNDYKVQSNQVVYFQLKVKNTSNIVLNNVKVVDTLPAHLNPLQGPGTYDSGSRKITFYIPTLNVNEEKVYYIKTQMVNNDVLKTISEICPTNRADVYINDISDSDTAGFCTNRPGVTPTPGMTIKQVPATGAEDWMLTLIGSIAALGLGISLKKKYS